MMVNSTGKPYLLQILLQSTEIIFLPVSLIVIINSLQRLSDAEVVFAKLIECDITSK